MPPPGRITCIPLERSIQIAGKVLREVPDFIEGQHKGAITFGTDNLLQKLTGRLLLKQKSIADRVAGINQQSHPKRQIGFRLKVHDLLGRKIVVQNLDVVLLQVFDEAAVLVRDGKDHVHQVRAYAELVGESQ